MKVFTGRVIAKSADKTATVAVERVVVHPIYKKRFKRIKKYAVHDEGNVGEIGQVVHFAASRPYSKTKKWAIIQLAGSFPTTAKKAGNKTEVRRRKAVSK